MKPLVSILIPAYNAEQWLAETLESALAQTWDNTEIIVVDDGSTDCSLAVAKQFESSIVKVISQENRGASAARNTALRQAQGDFLQYLDADDLLSPQKIEEQVRLLQQNPDGMLAVCGTTHFFDSHPIEQGIYDDGLPFLVNSDNPVQWLLTLWGVEGIAGMVHPAAWLTPRSVADAVGGWDECLSLDDDGEYFSRVVLNSTGIRRSESGVSYYRKYCDRSSLSGGNSARHYQSALRSIHSKASQIQARENSERVRQVIARMYQEVAIHAYPHYPQITEVALQKVYSLGGTAYIPVMGSPQLELLKKLFGWKVAKRSSLLFQTLKKVSPIK